MYRRYGWTMIALIALVVIYTRAPEGFRQFLAPYQPILLLESLLIFVFGASWFQKGLELASRESLPAPDQAQRRRRL